MARILPAKKSLVRSRVRKELRPATIFFSAHCRALTPPHSKSITVENCIRATEENFEYCDKHRAITCFKCGKCGHVVSACNSDAKPPRKCYACGNVGLLARECPTRAAHSKFQSSSSTSNAVAFAGKFAAQVFTAAVIGKVRIDALVDIGSRFSLLSSAMYGFLPNAFAIQPFTRDAPIVVGVENASAEIRGYVDSLVKIAGVAMHHPLLVVEKLASCLLIGTNILRPHDAMLTH